MTLESSCDMQNKFDVPWCYQLNFGTSDLHVAFIIVYRLYYSIPPSGICVLGK